MISKMSSWQTSLVHAVTNAKDLIELLELDQDLLPSAESAAKLFPLKVPRSFIARMEKGNPKDPLLLQVLPLGVEHTEVPGYVTDPLEESKMNPVPGLLHKYRSRVLLTLVGTCAVNCRFCFRRHFPYEKNNPGSEGWHKILDYIALDPTISEVILSGGDPLVCSDSLLKNFTDKLNAIAHVKRLRIHSRLPIVMPERITAGFIEWISQLKQKPVMIVHSNHPQEINDEVISAIQLLKTAGVLVLNQTVILKGINDSVETLVALSEKLFEAGIQPYYLYTLDKVQGTAHFDIEKQKAKDLHWGMAQCLSGYLVPKLMYEAPGAPAKLPVI